MAEQDGKRIVIIRSLPQTVCIDALLVNANDEAAANFYTHFSFTRLPLDELVPMV